METLTQIRPADIARQEHARQYELAMTREKNFRRAIEILEPQVEKYSKQFALFDRFDALVGDLDPTIDIGGRIGLLREGLQRMLGIGRADQQQRLDQCAATLQRAKEELMKAEAALKAFED